MDDQSTRTVGSYEEAFDFVKTPNIDALAPRACGLRRHTSVRMLARDDVDHHQHGIESTYGG